MTDRPSRPLFDGASLTGWTGDPRYWSVADGTIVGRNDGPVATSTYLFGDESSATSGWPCGRQTRGPEFSTMHSAVAALGERFADNAYAYGFRGRLLMFCGDWGIYDAYGRERVLPDGHSGFWEPAAERVGEWNEIEIIMRGDRIRMVAGGVEVFDHTEEPGRLVPAPVGLQLHSNDRPQELTFADLLIS